MVAAAAAAVDAVLAAAVTDAAAARVAAAAAAEGYVLQEADGELGLHDPQQMARQVTPATS